MKRLLFAILTVVCCFAAASKSDKLCTAQNPSVKNSAVVPTDSEVTSGAIYISDVTYTSDTTIVTGDDVEIGNNVTVTDNAEVTLIATGVLITGTFEVTTGATFTVN
jgi:acetyltransferase-like isoleucine patch superfamily enzyme